MSAPVAAPPASFLRVTEIFHSVQGESTWSGKPCVFVRLTGCPLRCSWCDTEYAFHGGSRMTFPEIERAVEAFGCPLVELTGGEPLAHPGAFALAQRFVDLGYTLLVETSGAFDVTPLPPEAHVIMDLKCPDSGECERNLWSNLDALDERDEVKLVLASQRDYVWARDTIREHGLEARVRDGTLGAVLLSPVVLADDPDDPHLLRSVAEWMLEDGLEARLQTQLHKLIWGADATGV